MAQQINLHIPVLLAPRHRFSAQAMAQALGVFALLLALASAAVHWTAQGLTRETLHTQQRQATERGQLQQALDIARQRNDPAVLARQLEGAQIDLQRLREQVLAHDSQRMPDGVRHSALLALIARSVPASAWVTGLRLSPRQVEISGVCLEPAALRRWIDELGHDPLLGAQALSDIRVEQVGEPHQGLNPNGNDSSALWHTGPLPHGPAWAFRIVSTRPLLDTTTLSSEIKR